MLGQDRKGKDRLGAGMKKQARNYRKVQEKTGNERK